MKYRLHILFFFSSFYHYLCLIIISHAVRERSYAYVCTYKVRISAWTLEIQDCRNRNSIIPSAILNLQCPTRPRRRGSRLTGGGDEQNEKREMKAHEREIRAENDEGGCMRCIDHESRRYATWSCSRKMRQPTGTMRYRSVSTGEYKTPIVRPLSSSFRWSPARKIESQARVPYLKSLIRESKWIHFSTCRLPQYVFFLANELIWMKYRLEGNMTRISIEKSSRSSAFDLQSRAKLSSPSGLPERHSKALFVSSFPRLNSAGNAE